jgi:hypothetical protein
VSSEKKRPASSLLKYYIHDSIDALRFELCGELTQWDVTELNGCWHTARTTLGSRKLILDVRKLTALDEGGREWLQSMANHGASFLPDGQLPRTFVSQVGQLDAPRKSLRKPGLWAKVLHLCPGTRS